MLRRISQALCVLCLLPGCAAAAPQERQAYVLAHPHAWVELTISDSVIPDVPAPDDESEEPWQRPYRCSVSVEVDGEPWFYGNGYPQGEAAPYAVETGFRFPVPAGETSVRMIYEGCRVVAGERESVTVGAELLAVESMVHELVFDGTRLVSHPPRTSTEVTLEDIYEAITGRRSPSD